MRYINIVISEAQKVQTEMSQLKITKDGQSFKYPLEDIDCIVFESTQCVISTYTLSKFAEHGIACFVCDKKHTPHGILMPFNTHFKRPEVLGLQLNAPKPLLKRLWQVLVKQKILNQAGCLKLNKKSGVEELQELVSKVQSGDASNTEAVAARKYFLYLFGNGFSRNRECFENAALNYCYSIVRGAIARTLSLFGFETCLGLGHHSSLNAFNLADDLIEPFRAMCDALVCTLDAVVDDKLYSYHKQILTGVMQLSCRVGDETVSVSYAIERLVESLKKSLSKGEVLLRLPEILPIMTKKYE